MKEYFYTKALASIVGILEILVAFGFGYIAFIGIGLSNAWDRESSSTAQYTPVIAIFTFLVIIGLITILGSFRLGNKVWHGIYIGFLVVIGIGFIISFIMFWGAIGTKSEIFILLIGCLYIGLSYLVYKRM